MKKLIVGAMLVLSSSSFASETKTTPVCFDAAIGTVQTLIMNTSYKIGNVSNQSTSGSAVFAAEVLLNNSLVGMYVVKMAPQDCSLTSVQFQHANP